MTKLQILQSELARLNIEILTDVGFTLRNKLKRISVITDTIAREAGNSGGIIQIIEGSSIIVNSGVPPNTIGNNGDIYIDSSTGNLYKKSNGVW